MNQALILNPSIIRPLAFGWKLSLKATCFLGAFFIISLVFFYVFQISAVTQTSFAIADYETRLAALDKEFKSLQVNFSDKSSLSDLEEVLVAKGYEKVGKIHYIQVLDSAVAAK